MLISRVVLAIPDKNIMSEAEILALVRNILVLFYSTHPSTGRSLVQPLDV
jgi:hypothetical protein